MWPVSLVFVSGTWLRQMSIASGQRVLKRHPLGRLIGLGISPRRATFSPLHPADGSGGGIARSSAPRVGVERVGEHLVAVTELHDGSEIHDRHTTGHVPDDRQVVGDEDHRQRELVPEIGKEVHDLCLNRDIKSTYGFVRDDELGRESEGTGDADPLALTARSA